MMRGHRRWHVRVWLILGPILAIGVGTAIWLRLTLREAPASQSMPLSQSTQMKFE